MSITADESRLSFSAVRDIQGTANTVTGRLAERIAALAATSAEVDAAMQRSIATGLADDRQALVTASRRLAAMLADGSAVAR